eukprot:CAMPEP_0117686708 /NCGR_PEP_ID=MMETSP0804-20121206/22633_1 /TAXON_ID=1074897 /ORGANISM="Tetraselmis astigmatica, Strain CCMP880" /LENGTH=462 /DNA_ID=CAMNT_0005498497 /DNA_START=30 /DNA_END=1415 /DNA_ORIENTATION=+
MMLSSVGDLGSPEEQEGGESLLEPVDAGEDPPLSGSEAEEKTPGGAVLETVDVMGPTAGEGAYGHRVTANAAAETVDDTAVEQQAGKDIYSGTAADGEESECQEQEATVAVGNVEVVAESEEVEAAAQEEVMEGQAEEAINGFSSAELQVDTGMTLSRAVEAMANTSVDEPPLPPSLTFSGLLQILEPYLGPGAMGVSMPWLSTAAPLLAVAGVVAGLMAWAVSFALSAVWYEPEASVASPPPSPAGTSYASNNSSLPNKSAVEQAASLAAERQQSPLSPGALLAQALATPLAGFFSSTLAIEATAAPAGVPVSRDIHKDFALAAASPPLEEPAFRTPEPPAAGTPQLQRQPIASLPAAQPGAAPAGPQALWTTPTALQGLPAGGRAWHEWLRSSQGPLIYPRGSATLPQPPVSRVLLCRCAAGPLYIHPSQRFHTATTATASQAAFLSTRGQTISFSPCSL